MEQLMLIVTPKAGKGQGTKALGSIISVFSRYGYITCVYMTTAGGDAARFAQKYGSEYDRLVCIGGDGTLSEVLEGLMRLEKDERPTIGYIPMGTANDVAASLALSKKPTDAAETVVTGIETDLDVGKMNGRAFSYIVAFGAFTEVPYTTPQDTKNVLGHLAYIIEGIGRIGDIKTHHATVTYDDGVIEGDFIFGCIMNTLSVGGIVKFDPSDVGLSDGYFEIILVNELKNVGDLSAIVAAVTSGNFNNESITFLHTKRARFEFSEPVSWTRDGEDGGTHIDVTVENNNCAVKILVSGGESGVI